MAKVAKLNGCFDVAESTGDREGFTVRRKPAGITPPNHILLLTIIDPYYPIDVNVIHSICQPFGNVVRLVIFRKNGVQAMVELESVDVAEKIKLGLDDKEIYAGCCRLKVDFAKPSKLNVVRNNTETWDYTKEPATQIIQSEEESPAKTGLLPLPASEIEYFEIEGDESEEGDLGGYTYSGIDVYDYEAVTSFVKNYTDFGGVVMAYNLSDRLMNPDGVFNLFCMYGNVWKIKFLKSKKGCAMIQMEDRRSAERALLYLQGVPLCGETLQLSISKQPFLGDMGRGFELSDGTNSWKDFSNSKNNRFLTPSMASKNRLNVPSKILHFFNMPPNMTEERLEAFVTGSTQLTLVDVTVFPNKSDKSSSGLMEFSSVADSVVCVVLCNNVPMRGADNGPPFFIKLCFSSVSSIANAEREYEKRLSKHEKPDWL